MATLLMVLTVYGRSAKMARLRPVSAPMRDLTALLNAWSAGDPSARDPLMEVVYQELRRRAARQLRGERRGHTLQPTALVHEAYLRLVDQRRIVWQNRGQFFGVACQMMRRILLTGQAGEQNDLVALPLAREGATGGSRVSGGGQSEAVGAPQVLLHTAFEESNGEVSPDGRWLAYQSNESGRDEVYVRPFPDVTRGRWQVSTEGGKMPLWARSGDELFYRLLDGEVVAVDVERANEWRHGRPTQVVPPGYFFGGEVVRTYDVSPDSRRFLMIKQNRSGGTTAAPYIVLVQDWHEELKRLVPVN